MPILNGFPVGGLDSAFCCRYRSAARQVRTRKPKTHATGRSRHPRASEGPFCSGLACRLHSDLFLWLTGWLANRFWLTFFATVAAGLYGLFNGPSYGVQPLVAGLGLALAAGILAKLLVRMLAYFAGGLAGFLVVHLLLPRSDEPVICVLAGGLLGVLLFRFWVMLFTSALGGVLMTYSCLCLLDTLGKLDMITLARYRRLP